MSRTQLCQLVMTSLHELFYVVSVDIRKPAIVYVCWKKYVEDSGVCQPVTKRETHWLSGQANRQVCCIKILEERNSNIRCEPWSRTE